MNATGEVNQGAYYPLYTVVSGGKISKREEFTRVAGKHTVDDENWFSLSENQLEILNYSVGVDMTGLDSEFEVIIMETKVVEIMTEINVLNN